MKILTCSQIRRAEERAVADGKTTYKQLMKNAGEKAAEILLREYSFAGKSTVVVCGKGNNGGDGLVIAKCLSLAGARVSLFFPLGTPVSHPAMEFLPDAADIETINFLPETCDYLIDALFGIGLDRKLEGEALSVVEAMNEVNAKKIAVDIPSGVMSDGGVQGRAFFADMTVTFIAPKLCFYLPYSSSFCGTVEVADIGVAVGEYEALTTEKPTHIKRNKNAHKGDFGTAVEICGSYGMCGAEILSAKAALRSGVGILKAVVCDKNYTAFCTAVPEAVTFPVPTATSGVPYVDQYMMEQILEKCDAVLVGCGLGRSEEAEKLVKRIINSVTVPIILDADGINAVCSDISIIGKIKAPVILTPHPAEMARLMHTSVSEIEKDRVGVARKFAADHSCIVVLKGANTVITSPDGRVFFNTTGNPGMATGGSGDVLSGMIAARLARGESALKAALSAVWLHGYAADRALEKITETALMPSDIIEELKFISE